MLAGQRPGMRRGPGVLGPPSPYNQFQSVPPPNQLSGGGGGPPTVPGHIPGAYAVGGAQMGSGPGLTTQLPVSFKAQPEFNLAGRIKGPSAPFTMCPYTRNRNSGTNTVAKAKV